MKTKINSGNLAKFIVTSTAFGLLAFTSFSLAGSKKVESNAQAKSVPPSPLLASPVESGFFPPDATAEQRVMPPSLVSPHAITNTANYAFSTATTASLTDMSSGTTTLVAADVDDSPASPLTNIGFDFFFQVTRYSQFSVNANGVIRLGAVAQTGSPYKPLAQASPITIITAYGADQRTHAVDGKVHFKVTGAAPNRVLNIEWLNMQANFNSGGTADLNYQVRLYETTGVIEFVYGSMTMSVAGAADANSKDPNIGFSSNSIANTVGSVTAAQSGAPPPTYDGASAVPVANLYTAGTITVLHSVADGSRRIFSFTPPVPTAPTGLFFTGVTSGGMTLNWTDSPDEQGYAIYRSTDNVNFVFDGTAVQNSVSYAASGLNPSTTYFWKVYAVSEGALSTALTGSQATNAPANIVSAASGNWSAPATWVGGAVPGGADTVTIADTHTVTIDTAAACATLTVGQGTSGILQYQDTATARSLTVGSNATVAAGGTLNAFPVPTVTGAHTLSVGGNLINNGTMNLNIVNGAFTSSAQITFTGASDAAWTLGASSSTNLKQTTGVSLNKGTNNTPTLTFTPAGTFTVVGANTLGFLSISNGTFKISGSGTFSNPVFNVAGYSIPATGGFWLNNANYTVVGLGGSATNSGLLRMTAGIYNIGSATGNSMGTGTGCTFIIEGGTMNVTGALSGSSTFVTYTQSAGTVNVRTIAGGATGTPSFGFTGTTGVLMNMFGGTINLVQASTAATPLDYNQTGTMNFIGGTLNIGTAATTTAFVFRVQGQMPNTIIDTTTNNKTANLSGQGNVWGNLTIPLGATLNLQNTAATQTLLMIGPTLTNNGAIAVTTTNTCQVNFAGPVQTVGAPYAQTYTGTGTFGAAVLRVGSVSCQNNLGVTLGAAVPMLNTYRINAFAGQITGSDRIAIGSGDATLLVIQRGATGIAFAAGSLDVSPVFAVGSGGLALVYSQSAVGVINTGPEIPAGRSILTIQILNPTGVNLTGGGLTATGITAGLNGLFLSSGTLNTSAANLLTLSGTATTAVSGGSAASYVNGPLARTLPASLVSGSTYTFPVGKGSFKMLELVNPTTNAGGTVIIQTEVFDADSGGSAGVGFSAINHNRYWSSALTAGAANFINTTVRLTEQGTPGVNAIGQSATVNGAYDSIGGVVTPPTIGPSTPAGTTLGFFAVGILTGAPTISGNSNVGAGGGFTTLTAAVAAFNSRLQTGPVTFTLTDGAYAGETFPIIINPNGGASATNTLTIKPAAGASPTFTGTSASAVIIINGADYVTIDGNNGGVMRGGITPNVPTRDVVITNTNISASSAVIWCQTIGTTDPATNITIKNLQLVGNAPTTTVAGVGFGGAAISLASLGTRNDNNRVDNIAVRSVQCGVYSQGASSTNKNVGNVVTGNQLGGAGALGLGREGIFVGFEDGVQVTNNTVTNVTGGVGSVDAIGIAVGSIAITTTSLGTIDDVANATVTGNTVTGVLKADTFSAAGIVVGTPFYSVIRIANNMVSGVNANGTAGDFAAGIFVGGNPLVAIQFYYNSVSMTGARDTGGTASSPSFAFAVLGSNPLIDIRNNALFNTQTSVGAGSNSYAIGLQSVAPFNNITSNFNVLFTSGAQSFFGRTGSLATSAGFDQTTLAAWQAATGKDANSISADPGFTSTSNLHLASNASPAANAGTLGTGITVDIDGDSRSLIKPDIGADEILSNKLATLVLSTVSISFDPNTFAYSPSVAHNVTSTTVTPTVQDSNATITVNAVTVASGGTSAPIALAVGNTVITIVVTPEFGSPQTYTVTVTRPPLPQVTNGTDGSSGSLRDIIAQAVDGDVITFASFRPGSAKADGIAIPNSGVVTLTSGELLINKNLVIDGGSAAATTVMRDSSAGPFRIFHVAVGKTVTIMRMKITGGLATGAAGGGIFNEGSLAVDRCAIVGNSADSSGAIQNGGSGVGTLVMLGSLVADNNATAGDGGAMRNDGSSVKLTNCTISTNHAVPAGADGGGILNGLGHTLSIGNCTIFKNTAGHDGGGINTAGTLTIRNSILAYNTAGNAGNNLFIGAGTATSGGYNLVSDDGGGNITDTLPGGPLFFAAGDQRNTDPMLGLRGNNGGQTEAYAPLVNSPAIDKGKDLNADGTASGTDQREGARGVNDGTVPPASGGDDSDIGAVELAIGTHPSGAASLKQHSVAGPTYAITLPLGGLPGVECRSGGAAGVYQIQLTFSPAITFTSGAAGAQVTNGTGSVTGVSRPEFIQGPNGPGSTVVTIDLTGVTNAQTITVALLNVNGVGDNDIGVRMGMLIGDVDGNRLTNSTDVSSVQFQSGQPLTGPLTGNYKNDINANGLINSSDVSEAEFRSGTGLPLPY
jgi:Cadherin-like beta sandwich domain